MHCETYNATIPEKTCLARMISVHTPMKPTDPGCARCETGKKLYDQYQKGEITMASLVETKKCTRKGCLAPIQPLSEFYGDKKSSDGKSSWCKVCQKQANTDSKKNKIEPKADKTPTDHQPDPAVDENILILDFSKHQDLLNGIRMAAKSELRDPDMQVFWWLYQREEFETA